MSSELIKTKNVLICVGAGGVGKTTSAAALALGAARQGLHSLVLTIDPAKRLANSLGLESLGHRIQKVDLKNCGIHKGSMSAMMLDQKKAFDEMVQKYSKNPASTIRILENPIYKQISSTLAGAQEYAALTKLQQYAANDDYDLIVVDTPPTAHALDFLEAPQKLAEAIDSPAIEWFRKLQRKKGWSLLGDSGTFILKKIATFVGSQFLNDISSFFTEFNDILGGFKARADEVFTLLQQDSIGFVIVFKPEEFVVKEALRFHNHLKRNRMPFAGFICNRVHPQRPLPQSLPQSRGDLQKTLNDTMAGLKKPSKQFEESLFSCYQDIEHLAQRDHDIIQSLKNKVPNAPMAVVPIFHSDVHDMDALLKIESYLNL